MPDWIHPLLAYLIGATPFGFLAAKLKGIDIRQHGSGNIGATNVLRVLGKPIGIAVLVLDALKGLVPVWIAQRLVATGDLIPILTAVAAILGHNYTFWLKFKGGKGIATSAGAMAPLLPVPLLVALVLWAILFRTTRYVSVASITAALSLPFTEAIRGYWSGTWSWGFFLLALFLGILATWRHRGNLTRLRAGTEPKFVPKSRRPPAMTNPGNDD